MLEAAHEHIDVHPDELLRAVAGRHRRRILFEVWGCERRAGAPAERLVLAPATV